MSGYWLIYEKEPPVDKVRSKKFRDDITFDMILSLYIFDRKLRLLLMEAIDRIEVALRSAWSNELSLRYGPHGYMDPLNFGSPWKHTEYMNRVASRVEDSNEVFHNYYKGKYCNPFLPPSWSVCQTMTMTELINWYSFTKDQNVKKFVARRLGFPSKEVADGALSSLRYVRNICAHHGRLWNRGLVVRLPLIKKFRADMVSNLEIQSGVSKEVPDNTTYNVLVVIMRLILNQNEATSFPSRVYGLIVELTDFQRNAMGFPSDWQARPIWEKAAN